MKAHGNLCSETVEASSGVKSVFLLEQPRVGVVRGTLSKRGAGPVAGVQVSSHQPFGFAEKTDGSYETLN